MSPSIHPPRPSRRLPAWAAVAAILAIACTSAAPSPAPSGRVASAPASPTRSTQPAPARSAAETTTSPGATAAPDSVSGTAPASDSAAAAEPAVLLAAGDIAICGEAEQATGDLLAAREGTVAALGDLAYPGGSVEEFATCYDDAWGAVRDRTRPVLGNHDIWTQDAAGYFGYFDDAAAAPPGGWYSYDLGDWHVVALNSNCEEYGGCGPDSPQARWLEEDLAAADRPNILAYWHHARFATGFHGDDTRTQTFWELLADAGADVVLAAHEHSYERFAPADAEGVPADDGIRQFVVGTGGAELRPFTQDPRDTTEFRDADTHGVLRLELRPCGYSWAFLDAADGEPVDDGSADGTCD